MKVEIYADIVCPWCYVGERRFARALERWPGREEVEVVLRAYQLDPTAPREATPLDEYLASRFGPGASRMREAVSAAGASVGIDFAWDRALAVNTRVPLRLLLLARGEGAEAQHALLERLFEAHFVRGENVADHDVLVAHAAAVGLDADRARRWLESGAGERELDEELARAREIGVRSVPTFVFEDEYAVSGAQPEEVFLAVLDEVERRAAGTQS